jgi:hypothetical protein
MRKFYGILLTAFLLSISVTSLTQEKYWSSYSGSRNIPTDKAVARQSFPKEFKLFTLDINSLRQELFAITGNQAARRTTVISLPDVDGNIEQFEVVEASNFEPALQARFPEIRAFSGKGITDKASTLKLSISPQGIQTMVFRTGKQNEFIEAYSADHTVYAVFNSFRQPGQLPWSCTTADQQLATELNSQVSTLRLQASDGNLRVMRLAQSCNGEYSNFFGATSVAQEALVVAAFNATITRCNGVFEKDLAIHLNLIAGTTAVIFYDPASDPYTSIGNWNSQLQTALTNLIGEANYDIGHMFGASGGGGNAGCIGCVCEPGKGRGITSPGDGIPQGDNFDIDYVVHEMGHQMGGTHTFSHSTLESALVNKEVGSGITIMGYAGITGFDVAPHSIDIFHETSIQQIMTNMIPKTCPVITNISANNATPVVAPHGNFTIPITTPFALTGSATDANAGDVLTYCWEQNDNATTTGSQSIASPAKATGPNWLSFLPTTSPTRLFPRLSTILNGASVTGPLAGGDPGANIEALSSIGRTLNFRLTVRDNSLYSSTAPVKAGQTASTDVVVTVDATTGPFLITSQNAAISYAGATTQTVTWSVNGTTGAPINCANVKISFSTDNGATFPTVLAASTPNDGTENFTVPSTLTTTGRIKVEAIGNIFFDINNANITITAPATGFDFDSPAPATVACAGPATANLTLGTTSAGGFITPINLAATAGVPAGTTVTFVPNPVVPGNSTIVTLNSVNTLAAGNYDITITGTAGAVIRTRVVRFTVNAGAGPVINTPPSPQTVCSGIDATFNVAATGALSYLWQVSTDGGANYNTAPGVNNTASYTVTSVTVAQNNNRYRVIVTGQCNSTTSAAALLTVQIPPSISQHPQNTTLCVGQTANFSVTAAGTNLTYLWEVSTDGGANYNPAPGANTSSAYASPTLTAAMNNYRYRVVVSGTCTPSVTSNAGVLTVISPVTIADDPDNVTICETGNVTLTVAAVSSVTVIYEWQVSTNGGGSYTTVTNTAPYSGATGPALTITGVTPALNGNLYRVRASNATCTTPAVSVPATLTVDARPTVTLSAAPLTTLLPGQSTTLTATINGNPAGFNITWYKNDAVIPGVTGTTYLVDSVEVGNYKVSIVNTVTGCNNESQVLTISTTQSERLFIFPSPNNGLFTVSYYNSSLGGPTTQTISIYNSHGALIYNKAMTIQGFYTLNSIDLRGAARGVYFVVIGDRNGKRIAKDKVVIH